VKQNVILWIQISEKIAHILKPMGKVLQEQIFIYCTDIQSYGYEISDR